MKYLVTAVFLTVLTAPAHAQLLRETIAPDATADAFKAQDTNGDGALSLDEAKHADGTLTEDEFLMYDSDKDMTLSLSEFAKFEEARSTPPASLPA